MLLMFVMVPNIGVLAAALLLAQRKMVLK